MIENANNLLMTSKLRMSETKFTNDYAAEMKRREVRDQMRGIKGGVDSPEAQYLYARNVLGYDGQELEAAVTSGSIAIPADFMEDREVEAEGTDIWGTLAGQVTTKRARERIASMKEKFDGYKRPSGYEERVGLPAEEKPELTLAAWIVSPGR